MNKYTNILQEAQGLKETIVNLRRDFHEYPELSFKEFQTAKKVERFLKELGIETEMLANGSGVRGLLRGKKKGKTIALRADMDALPIEEKSNVPFRSRNSGAMHACGHDCHTAMLLGAAAILGKQREELQGNVVFIFQPAEEIGEGAKKMVDEGVLEGVDCIFGVHITSSFDSGTIGYRTGPLLAAGDFFEVVINGKGAHGGMPHLSIDPVAIAASSILTIQTIISRETDPLESAVISICKLNAGGDAYNVIPDSVTFGGTIRYHNTKLAKYLPDRISEILGGIVPAMRGSYKFELFRKFPATINDEAMTTLASNVAEEAFGKENVFRMNPRMGSEDFSYYLQKIPGTFVFLGAKNEEKGIVYPQHHPMFDVDEDALPSGAALHSAVVLEYLAHRD